MRFGVVWREVCLDSELDYADWIEKRDTLDANHAVEILTEILRKEGHSIPEDALELAELLLHRFVPYPLGDGMIPYNYCAVPDVVPAPSKTAFESILRPFCKPKYDY